jgi:hypothetical protein
MNLPLLTEFDPETKSEGSLDPLGTYPLADKFATRLIPGFRERMRRPRFLTAMAVGAVTCIGYDEEEVAADEISPPYQVYEWHVVQALVKQFRGKHEIIGLPGSDKANRALNQNLRLNASRYLKTASVFGFHGVYRTLANELDIIDNGRLGEGGDKLIRAWEKDQNLPGFYENREGAGKSFKNSLAFAVKEAMGKGEVVRAWSWGHFTAIAENLVPSNIGIHEGKVLYDLIVNNHQGHRNIVIPALTEYLKLTPDNKEIDEGSFYQILLKNSTGDLYHLLNSIIAYEAFSRTLTNGFEEILYYLSQNRREVDIREFLDLQYIKDGSAIIASQYKKCLNSLTETTDKLAFQNNFEEFEDSNDPLHFTGLLIAHHQKIQKNKPPNGKLDWIVQTGNGKWLIRSNYLRSQNLVKPANTFVHFYRTNSLRSFLMDLKKL